MNISEKIEAIRKEPEHIRLRYVWMCVGASMVLILTIWFFSISAMLKKGNVQTSQEGSLTELKDQIENINQQAPSLKDLSEGLQTKNEGVVENSKNNDFQYPISESDSQIPESPAYYTE